VSKAVMFVISALCDTFPISTPLFMVLVEQDRDIEEYISL